MRKVLSLFVSFAILISGIILAGGQTKNDARALELLRQAREAIGGEAVINAVQSLSMAGKVRKNLTLPDRTEAIEGTVESAFILPNQYFKKMQITSAPRTAGTGVKTEMKVLVSEDSEIRTDAGMTGAPHVEKHVTARVERSGNEFANQVIGLLLTSPAGFEPVYNYLGEGDVDGTNCEIIGVSGTNSLAVKLYLDKSSHVPVALSFRGMKSPSVIIFKHAPDGAHPQGGNVVIMKKDAPTGEAGNGRQVIINDDKITIVRKDANGNITESKTGDIDMAQMAKRKAEMAQMKMEEADIMVKFSDYRSVNGLLLPFRLTQTSNGQADEETTVETYEINAPNVSEKFVKENGNIIIKKGVVKQ